MKVEIKSGFTLWISFIDVERNEQIALAIYNKEKQYYVGRIKKQVQDLFENQVDEFAYKKDAKEWDIARDLKQRIEKLYGKITYIDNTFRWPMSKTKLMNGNRNTKKPYKATRSIGKKNVQNWHLQENL